MNTTNLRRLIDHLANTPADHFDMGHYVAGPDAKFIHDIPEHTRLRNHGLHRRPHRPRLPRRADHHRPHPQPRPDWLGLNTPEAHELFLGCWTTSPSPTVTLDEAIKHLEDPRVTLVRFTLRSVCHDRTRTAIAAAQPSACPSARPTTPSATRATIICRAEQYARFMIRRDGGAELVAPPILPNRREQQPMITQEQFNTMIRGLDAQNWLRLLRPRQRPVRLPSPRAANAPSAS